VSSDATRTVTGQAGGSAQVGGSAKIGSTAQVGSAKVGRPKIGWPSLGRIPPARTKPGTYIGETYAGDLDATMGGTPVVANDGEPAGLARVTLAMRPETKEPPAPGRLVGLCAWAAVIGIIGLVLGIRSAFAIISGAPGWFAAIAPIVGLVGFTSTLGAFVTARWRTAPWALLGVASLTIIVALILVLAL
jgi:hypothetical protein